MSLKPKKIKNLEKEIPEIISRDIEELNHLTDEDLLSLWDFFKFLVTEVPDGANMVFVTGRDSLIAEHREILAEKFGIIIEIAGELMAG